MKIRIVTGVLAVLPFFFISISTSAQAPSPLSRQVTASYGKLPLSFEPNRGQTDARVQFVSRGAGYAIFLSPASATFSLHRPATAVRRDPRGEHLTAEAAVVRMDLLGANADVVMQPQDKLPGTTNYLMGSTRTKWSTNLPTYAKTRARNVYPGIDLVYYGTQGQLEYDFVLAPRAEPSMIRLRFVGARPVIDASGDLVLALRGTDSQNDIRFRKPVLYQQVEGVRRHVNGRFIIAGDHEVGFEVSRYDHSRELVIDPELVYSSYLGGSNISQINAMAVNAAGDIYVTGNTEAINYPTTTGVIQPTCPLGNTQLGAPAGVPKCGEGESGTPAVFVSKISANGQTLIYATYLGGGGNGAGSDLGTGIAVDANDNAWVVGETGSNDFPITANAYLSYCNPVAQGFNFGTDQNYGEISGCIGNDTQSVFLVQLNPSGTTMLYGTFLGGSGDERAAQIVLDAAGNIYIAGSAYTGGVGTPASVFSNNGQFNFPTTASAYQPVVLGGDSYSAFVTELAPGGRSLLYSTMFSGPNQNTYNNALAIGAGKIFIGGYTQDPHLPTTSSAISHTCVGGPTAAGPDTVCTNNSPNAYVAEFDPTKSGAASLVFSTYLNGSVSTQGNESSSVNALAADAAGNVYAGGQDTYTAQEGFPATPGVLQPTCLVARNSGECGTGFVTKFSPSGALVWSTFYGSPSGAGGNQAVAVIALDSSSDVYIAANASGAGDLPLNNSFQSYAGGVAYVTELSSNGSQVLFGTFYGGNDNVFPTGMVVDAAGNIYLAGYTAGNLPLVNALQSNNYGGGFAEGFFAKIGAPSITLVANAEGDGPTIAPNTWVEIKGTSLGPVGDTRIWLASDFVNSQMPTQLDGISVKMNGENAYVYYISPIQVNVLTPSDLKSGPVQVEVISGGTTSAAFTAQGQPLSPSFFVFAGGYVIGSHLNGSILGPTSLYPGSSTPAQPGELVVLYANGFGPTSTPVVPGSSVQSGMLPAQPSVQIGGINAAVQFAGLVAPGEYQFNVYVPASAPNGDNPIVVQYGGLSTQAGVLLTVQQ
jgi:uncharacterized protein (TIGR03437 family)